MDEADAFDVKLRKFFSDVAVTFKRTKQRAEETFGNVERTKFDAEIETQWWMLLTAQKEIKDVKLALEALMQPNPALRFEKAILNRIDTENVLSDLFDRPVENSNYKDLSLNLYKASSELEGISSITSVLRSVADTENEISKYEHKFRQTTNALVLAQMNDFLVMAEGVIQERKKLENIRLDLDASKNQLRRVMTLEQRNVMNEELFQNEEKFEDGQAIFKGLLSSAINSLNDQTDAWKTFLESQRDFLTCSASKADEVCALYTDNYSSPLQTSLQEASRPSTSSLNSDIRREPIEEFQIIEGGSSMSQASTSEVAVDVPADYTEDNDLKPHVSEQIRAEARKETSIKKLSKFLSFLPGMKKKNEPNESEAIIPVFSIPEGSTDKEIIAQMRSEMERISMDKKRLESKVERLTTCPICDEKYDNVGVRSPMKLKCAHIICIQCAFLWLNSKGKQATCPTCRLPYREQDVQKVHIHL